MARDIGISEQAESLVDAVLEGGPDDITPAQRTRSVSAAQAKIKIERLGGYEHFERQEDSIVDHVRLAVFRWTMRTRMAE